MLSLILYCVSDWLTVFRSLRRLPVVTSTSDWFTEYGEPIRSGVLGVPSQHGFFFLEISFASEIW